MARTDTSPRTVVAECLSELQRLNTVFAFVLCVVIPSKLPAGEASLYWSILQSNEIYSSSTDGRNEQVIAVSAGGIVPNIAVDYQEEVLYWPSAVAGGIQRARLDGSGVGLAVDGIGGPAAVAWDSRNKMLYWYDYETEGIWRSGPDGSDKANLLSDLPAVKDIVVDPTNGYFYWTEFLDGTIQQTGIETLETKAVFDRDVFGKAGLPNSLAIDPSGSSIYFSDQILGAVVRVGTDGANAKILWQGDSGTPYALALDEQRGRLLWSVDDFVSPVLSSDFLGGDLRVEFTPDAFFGYAKIRHIALGPIQVPEQRGIALSALAGVGAYSLRRRATSSCER